MEELEYRIEQLEALVEDKEYIDSDNKLEDVINELEINLYELNIDSSYWKIKNLQARLNSIKDVLDIENNDSSRDYDYDVNSKDAWD